MDTRDAHPAHFLSSTAAFHPFHVTNYHLHWWEHELTASPPMKRSPRYPEGAHGKNNSDRTARDHRGLDGRRRRLGGPKNHREPLGVPEAAAGVVAGAAWLGPGLAANSPPLSAGVNVPLSLNHTGAVSLTLEDSPDTVGPDAILDGLDRAKATARRTGRAWSRRGHPLQARIRRMISAPSTPVGPTRD
jgi:hypothetical protein